MNLSGRGRICGAHREAMKARSPTACCRPGCLRSSVIAFLPSPPWRRRGVYPGRNRTSLVRVSRLPQRRFDAKPGASTGTHLCSTSKMPSGAREPGGSFLRRTGVPHCTQRRDRALFVRARYPRIAGDSDRQNGRHRRWLDPPPLSRMARPTAGSRRRPGIHSPTQLRRRWHVHEHNDIVQQVELPLSPEQRITAWT